MKKLLASILLVTYLAFTCGVVINFHYCMDRLASTQFFVGEDKTCGKCGMHNDDSNGCCRDEIQVVKIRDDQQKTQAIEFSSETPVLTIAFTSSYLVLPFLNADLTRHYHNHSPPLLSQQDTYLRNGVFRI